MHIDTEQTQIDGNVYLYDTILLLNYWENIDAAWQRIATPGNVHDEWHEESVPVTNKIRARVSAGNTMRSDIKLCAGVIKSLIFKTDRLTSDCSGDGSMHYSWTSKKALNETTSTDETAGRPRWLLHS